MLMELFLTLGWDFKGFYPKSIWSRSGDGDGFVDKAAF